MVKFLRENRIASMFLLLFRLYLGYEWIIAGVEKLSKGFDAKGFLIGASKTAMGPHPAVQTWWAHFLTGFAIPNAGFFTHVIPYGELLVGIGLVLGCLTTAAGFFAVVMNFAYMFSGTTSTNPQMILLTIFILVAGSNAGRYGLDRYVLPLIRKVFNKKVKEDTEV